MEPCYLVYRLINGKLNAEIQYGLHQTGEGIKNDPSEVKRVLLNKDLTLTEAIKEYPYEL